MTTGVNWTCNVWCWLFNGAQFVKRWFAVTFVFVDSKMFKRISKTWRRCAATQGEVAASWSLVDQSLACAGFSCVAPPAPTSAVGRFFESVKSKMSVLCVSCPAFYKKFVLFQCVPVAYGRIRWCCRFSYAQHKQQNTRIVLLGENIILSISKIISSPWLDCKSKIA